MRLSVVFGRFNPPTVEHEKLLDSVRYCDSDKRIIVLMGGKEAPLSLFDRLIYIRWLYPDIDIIPTTTKHFENIPLALIKLREMFPTSEELVVHCGAGETGLKTKSKLI